MEWITDWSAKYLAPGLIVAASVCHFGLEEPAEGAADTEEEEDPEQRDDCGEGQPAGRHEEVGEIDIDDDRSQQCEGQRHVAVDKQQNCRNDLEDTHNEHVVGRDERAAELRERPWRQRRCGHE